MPEYQNVQGLLAGPVKQEVLRFLVTGALSTAVNYGVFAVLLYLGVMNHLFASASGFILGTVFGYQLNRRWTFGHQQSRGLARYLAVYTTSLVIGLVVLDVLVSVFGLNAYLSNFLVIGLTTCTNFAGIKLAVFRDHSTNHLREEPAEGRAEMVVTRRNRIWARIQAEPLFWSGVIIKLLLGAQFASPVMSEGFLPFVNSYIGSGFQDPYQLALSEGLDAAFPYPGLMLYLVSLPLVLLNLLVDTPTITQQLIAFRVSPFVGDLAMLAVLAHWFREHLRRVLVLYWLSPVLIFITYVHGQLDVIPMAVAFVSLYLMFKEKLLASAIMIGMALSTKTHLVIILPFIFFYLRTLQLAPRSIINYFSLAAVAFIVPNIPFAESRAFIEMVLVNPQQMKIFSPAVQMTGGVSIFVVPALYVLLLFRASSLQLYSRNVLMMLLAFAFGMILVFVPPQAGWYYWVLPFLMFYYLRDLRNVVLMVVLQTAFLAYFILKEQGGAWLLMHTGLAEEQLALLTNSAFTVMQVMMLINCLWLYTRGLKEQARSKINARPFLLGIGGDSGVGKSKLAGSLASILGGRNTTVVRGDDMHRWERGHEKWNEFTHLDPKANQLHDEYFALKALKEGRVIRRRHYDHSNGKFTSEKEVKPNRVTLFEGLHPFYIEKLRRIYDFRIFVSPDAELAQHWKIVRDAGARSYTVDQVVAQINRRKDDAQKYINIQSAHADMLIQYCLEEPMAELGNPDMQPKTSLRLRLKNSYDLVPIVDALLLQPELQVTHLYGDNDHQYLEVSGSISGELLGEIAGVLVPGLEDIGVFDPVLPDDLHGVVCLVAIYCIFEGGEA